MSTETNELLLVLAIVAFGIFTIYRFIRFVAESWHFRKREELQAKAEAMFQAQFPELQPHFHPRAVAKYVLARHQRRQSAPPTDWSDPPGFTTAKRAAFSSDEKGERTVLLDQHGQTMAQFLYNADERPEVIATLRLGEGKFTVRQAPKAQPVVKYWHPAREFTWKGEGLWSFKTPLADEPISSDSDRMSWSSSSSSTSSSTDRAVAAAAFAGAGGAFDGGGASQGWDEAPGSAASQQAGSMDAGTSGVVSDSGTGTSESTTSY